MSILPNHQVCFYRENLLKSSHNFRHKILGIPRRKSPKLQGTHPISCKTNISKRDKMFLADHKKRNLQNIRGKLRSDPYLDPK